MANYTKFPIYDDTAISVHPYISNESVEPHQHNFQEFVLIQKGSCIHRYKNQETILIPGDVFLIPPHREHSYVIQSEVEIINVCFFPEKLGVYWTDFVHDMEDPITSSNNVQSRFQELLQNVMLQDDRDTPIYEADLNTQGIIHLKPTELFRIEDLLRSMLEEQENQDEGAAYMKSAMLQMILILLDRVRKRQIVPSLQYSSQKRQIILEALDYIENHITEDIDFSSLAAWLHLSNSHFRAVFKNVTGLPPTDYLNRLRIVKSLQYLQTNDVSIADVAARVGIYDPNYFSRLFKKIMGVPPKYFKK